MVRWWMLYGCCLLNNARDYHVITQALLLFRVTPRFCVPCRHAGTHRLLPSTFGFKIVTDLVKMHSVLYGGGGVIKCIMVWRKSRDNTVSSLNATQLLLTKRRIWTLFSTHVAFVSLVYEIHKPGIRTTSVEYFSVTHTHTVMKPPPWRVIKHRPFRKHNHATDP
jgi:hypothetical protein